MKTFIIAEAGINHNKNYDLAIKYARKDDHAAQAHFMKGYSFFRMKKIDDACNNFKIASKLEGKSYQESFNKYCN